ncbi:hypothetical protein MUB24_03915 [Lederbergia sp. NSJ-179]|uniref:hypothetical protein n=1 Tax=Lederbergia sp. NSJ-179 TaxID=2931402 RepID=UPI001FD47A17|nr:hypothetical protein [Lederbergia sp. NSJ-179]MCJ7840071.1 hypothetical protein [Lederbergia sp. NSJ-179]
MCKFIWFKKYIMDGEKKVQQLALKLQQLALKLQQLALKLQQLALKLQQLALKLQQLALKLQQLALKLQQLALKLQQLALKLQQLALKSGLPLMGNPLFADNFLNRFFFMPYTPCYFLQFGILLSCMFVTWIVVIF